MTMLKIDEAELRSRREFCELTEADLARLRDLQPFAERHVDALVDDFYAWLLRHDPTREFLPDEATIRRVKQSQRRYFLGLFDGRCDSAYVEDKLRVGVAHERIGLSPISYLGACRKYLSLLQARLAGELPVADASAALQSLTKLLFFDEALAIDTYIHASIETIGRHQHALRELATPVIRVHDRILLLPLIGAIDGRRAEQVTDAVLARTAEEHAKVVLIDIAGVAVVDTNVARSLVSLAASVRLLGTKTVVTGITARVSQTIVRLGIDTSMLETRSSLQQGIALALDLVGKVIVKRSSVPLDANPRGRREER